MSNKLFFQTVCGAIMALLLLNGCNKDVDNGLITSVYMRDKFNQTADTFYPGDEINMTLSIKNDSTSTKTLSFSNGQQHDFIIRDGAGTATWQWSEFRTFDPDPTTLILGPTDIQTITYTWNQTIPTETVELIDGVATTVLQYNDIPAGSYTLEANFIGHDKAQTTLTILP